jgi:hypothetical protein
MPVPIEDEMSDPMETSESRETMSGAASRGLPKEPVGWPSRVCAWPGDAPIGHRRGSSLAGRLRGSGGGGVIGVGRVGRDEGFQRVMMRRRST